MKTWTGNNRAPWHDYTSRCIYHITLLKHPDTPPFGTLAGDYRLPPDSYGSSYLCASAVGRAIKQGLRELPALHSALRLFQYALMPDHLHLILSAETGLDEIIGRKIAAFKVMVNKKAGIEQVFERGFNDQILTKARSLDTIYRYLKANPYRLAVRRACPDFFHRSSGMIIGETACHLYGNHHLLSNPFKEQVIVHRADTDAEYQFNRERWIHTAANGGVLVSPFISRREKEIRSEAELAGGRLILITNRPFGERDKPSGKDFDLCAGGRMLIISPADPLPLNRSTCRLMNSLAAIIALR